MLTAANWNLKPEGNTLLELLETRNITETKKTIMVGALIVAGKVDTEEEKKQYVKKHTEVNEFC